MSGCSIGTSSTPTEAPSSPTSEPSRTAPATLARTPTAEPAIPRGATELRSVGDRLFAVGSDGVATHSFNQESQGWEPIPHGRGLIGPEPLSLDNLPRSLTSPLETNTANIPRFIAADGNPLPFGIYRINEGRPYTFPPTNWNSPFISAEYQMRYRGEVPANLFPADSNVSRGNRVFLFEIPGEFVDLKTGDALNLGYRRFAAFQVPRNIPGVQEPRPITIRRTSGLNLSQVDSVGSAMDTNVFSDLLANMQPGTPIIIRTVHYDDASENRLQVAGREYLDWLRREETRLLEAFMEGRPVNAQVYYEILGAIINR